MGLPRKLTHFATFVDGTNYMGEMPEVTLPTLTRKMEEYRGGGMNGPIDLDMGQEKMEAELKGAGWLKDIAKKWGSHRHDAVMIRFAGALNDDESEGWTPVEVVMRGRLSEIDPGSSKAGDTTERGAFALAATGGAVSGSGRVEWTNGESYVGTLVEGRKHGKGRFNWVGGQWYEGDWTDDRAVGQGVIQFAGGNRYEGSVLDGEPSGRGTLIFPTGDRYTGDFARGVFHGQGRFAWKNGNRYEGAWRLGRKHGQGRLTWAGGDGWEGEFRDDQQTDNGKSFDAPK